MVKGFINQTNWHGNGGQKQQMKETKEAKLRFKILKYWTKQKVNQQRLHPRHHQHLLPPSVVRRATHHNPVDRHFQNARAAARCNIATRTASERIGGQEVTNKNAND